MSTLTDATVKRLPPPQTGNRIFYDDPPGFGVRITAAGVRAFVFNYRVRGSGRERRFTIGKYPSWSVGAARAKAQQLRRLVDQGGDPLGDIEAAREAPTVADLIARFDAEHIGPRLRKGTARAYRLLVRNHIAPHFGTHMKVADVAFADVDALHRKVTRGGSTYAANRCLAVLSKMFALSIRWGMRDSNPVRGVEKNTEAKRKRYLSGDELGALTKALAAHPDQQVSNIVRLLLLTGARSSEVMGMRWTDLDLTTGTWTKPASTTKQKSDHTVPLSAPARQLLSEVTRQTEVPWVFPSSNNKAGHVVTIERAWTTICKAAGIRGLRVHDLRHSFASTLASSGGTLPLIGALLGHSNAATTHRYAHIFQDPQRAAVEKVGAIITGTAPAEVVPLPAVRK